MVGKLTKDEGYEERFLHMIEIVGGWDKSAKVADRSVAQLKRYAKGDDIPFSVLFLLAEAADLSIDWISTGFSNPFENDRTEHLARNIENEIKELQPPLIYIPLIDIQASAGGGALAIEEKAKALLAFQKEYLRGTWSVSTSKLFCMEVQGESMVPTIQHGEILICSYDERHIAPSDGVFVIRLEGAIMVKRLQFLPGRKFKVSSDNSIYDPFEVQLDDGVDFKILGKVLLVNGLRRV